MRNTSSSVYMTGRAGTGKSTFLRYIIENVRKKTVVLAPTGIAAVNVGGVTMHSFFRIPLHPLALDDVNYSTPARLKDMVKFSREKIKLIQELELIVIDEVSMVRADVLDFVDRVLRTFTNQRTVPFGGKQLLLVGDAFQLEPVVKHDEWDILRRFYRSPYFFDAVVFSQIQLVQIELKKVYRQKEEAFLSILDRVRSGAYLPMDLEQLNRRVGVAGESEKLNITLCATKASADCINDARLEEIKESAMTFVGQTMGDYPESSKPAPQTLILKRTAQVIMLRNDKERRWYNGSIATVESIEEDGVWISMDGEAYFVVPETWENMRYKYDETEKKVVEEILGTYTQLPMRLAWAITIHKSQGLTFENVTIDLGRRAFACGQVYVALSRCRTLEGIKLLSPIKSDDIKTNSSVVAFAREANNREVIESELKKAEAMRAYQLANAQFKEGKFREAVESLMRGFKAVPQDMDSEVVRRFIAMRLGKITSMKNMMDHMAEQQHKQRKALKEFAEEYYLMAVESIRKYNLANAALGNVNKCIKLDPDHIPARSLRCELYMGEGDCDRALRDINHVLKFDKYGTAYMRQKAQVLIKMRNYKGAYDTLIRVVRIDESDAEAYRLLAVVCRAQGRNEEAEEFDDIADALSP